VVSDFFALAMIVSSPALVFVMDDSRNLNDRGN
jgi:hypothetical protein